MLLQQFYALKLAKENNITVRKINIDHKNAKTFINNKEYRLLFPQYMINTLHNLDKTKTIDYFFSGIITKRREWIQEFVGDNSIIKESDYGKDRSKKYNLDIDYYTNMSKSKFTLCPVGDCPWSYRFFEAIMCKSIPIIGDTENDILSCGYFFYRKSDKHIYDEEKIIFNYYKFIKENKI